MKKKILKIMGVALTLMLVFSLGAVFTATPVLADDDEWTTYDYPDGGSDGDWFREPSDGLAALDNDDIIAIGPVARDSDGYFWISATIDANGDGALAAGEQEILVSLDTEGRSWEVTEFSDDLGVAALTLTAEVVAIVTSTEDADVVYVAVGDDTAVVDAVYKTEDGGDEWTEVSDLSAAITTAGGAATEEVSCMTVGWADDEPHVYVGSLDTTVPDHGEVYYINDVAFGGAWTDLDVQGTDTGIAAELSQVFAIAASSDFDNDALVAAVIVCDIAPLGVWVTANVDQTLVVTNVGATVADWPDVELVDDGAGTDPAFAAGIAFVDDFDDTDAYEFFVAVSGDFHAATFLGGVYRIYNAEPLTVADLLDDVDADIATIDLAGDVGATYLLVGEDGDNDVWYSDDDGDNWEQASEEGINPSGGAVDTIVICGDDIADDGIGWAVTGVAEGCVSMTNDGGTSWVGISMIHTDIDTVEGLALSPTFASDGYMFVLTDDAASTNDSIFRYDGTNWERVWESATQYAVIDTIAVSPDIDSDDTAWAALSGAAPLLYFTEDNGTMWEETREAPATFGTWVIIDNETLLVGGAADGTVYYSDIQGRRAWDDYAIETPGSTCTSLVVSGDTVIAGNDDSDVFISEDLGETWDVVGDKVDGANVNTFVAFDTDDISVIYAATDDTIARFLDTSELDEDWENFDLDPTVDFWTFAFGGNIATGLVVVDGVLYASCDEPVVLQTGAVNVGRGAVTRTVNPLEDLDDVDESEFDQTSLAAQGLTALDIFNSLDATTGSTILWAHDTATATIWTLEDLLAGAATDGVADPGEDSVTLIWDGFDNATNYDVLVFSDEDMGIAYEWYDPPAGTGDDDPVASVTNLTTTGINATNALDAGTQYWWQVRATAPADSKWSAVWTFTTDPATMDIDEDMFGPAIGATEVSITPSFGWQLIVEADYYEFELADNPNFLSPIASTTTNNPVYDLETTLAYATNYFWRVKAISGIAESNWATGTFTTAAEPVEAPAPPAPAAPPVIEIPPTPAAIAPQWIYAVIGIGAALMAVVIVLIVRTRKQ